MKSASVIYEAGNRSFTHSLHPSELSIEFPSKLSSLARNDQVNCRCSVPVGPRWLFNLMSYYRRPLERDVSTATGFHDADDRPFMLNEFVADRAAHTGLSYSANTQDRPHVHTRACLARADLRRGTSSWNFDATTSAQREPIDN